MLVKPAVGYADAAADGRRSTSDYHVSRIRYGHRAAVDGEKRAGAGKADVAGGPRCVANVRPAHAHPVLDPILEGGVAEAELLLGLDTPSGKLADTFAATLEDYPSSPNFYE